MLNIFRRLCRGAKAVPEADGAVARYEKGKIDSGQTTIDTNMADITQHVNGGDKRQIYQPLHSSVRTTLDPEYVAFHDKYIQYVEPEQMKPWTPSIRTRQLWPYTGSPVLSVGSIRDFQPCPNFTIRVFDPKSRSSDYLRPVVIWFHGGGFAGGSIGSDNDLCSLLCKELDAVVINMDYRLAPEHPYPAAIEDVAEVLQWVGSEAAVEQLAIDRNKIVIGGASAGANIATVGAMIAGEHSIPLIGQILVVPLTDNTSTLETNWASHPHAAGLTPPRLTWYRDLYLQELKDVKDWRVSPLYAPPEIMSTQPRTWIAIADQDLLSTEGLAYAASLRTAGVEVDVRIYPGMPHAMMAMSGELNAICSIVL